MEYEHRNREGLTFKSWLAAARVGAASAGYSLDTLRRAWRAGECPCDYAAGSASVTRYACRNTLAVAFRR